MAYFAVSYDLNDEKDYKRLTDELKSLGAVKAQLSYWLVELNSATADVKEHLADFVDDDDMLMVIRFTDRPRFTRAFKPAIEWIKEHFGP